MAKKTPKFLGLLNFIWPIFRLGLVGLAYRSRLGAKYLYTLGPPKTHGKNGGVLIPRNMGEITPKNEGNVGSHGNMCIYIYAYASIGKLPGFLPKFKGNSLDGTILLGTMSRDVTGIW